MKVTWDPDKAARNLVGHRVSFEDAATVFALPEHIRFTVFDAGHDDDEDRWAPLVS